MRPPSLQRRWLLIFLLIFFLITQSFGLRESEVGKHDWVMKGIGRVTTISSDPHCTSCPVAYVGSELGVVASVDLHTGSVLWRAMTGEGYVVAKLIIGHNTIVAITSKVSNIPTSASSSSSSFQTRNNGLFSGDDNRHDSAVYEYNNIYPEGITSVYVYNKALGHLLLVKENYSCYFQGICIHDFDTVFLSASTSVPQREHPLAILGHNSVSITHLPLARPELNPQPFFTTSADQLGASCNYAPSTLLLHRLIPIDSKQVAILATRPAIQENDNGSFRSSTVLPIKFILIYIKDVTKTNQDYYCREIETTVPGDDINNKNRILFPRSYLATPSDIHDNNFNLELFRKSFQLIQSPINVAADFTTITLLNVEKKIAYGINIAHEINELLLMGSNQNEKSFHKNLVHIIDLLPLISAQRALLADHHNSLDYLDAELSWTCNALPKGYIALGNRYEMFLFQSTIDDNFDINWQLSDKREGQWVYTGLQHVFFSKGRDGMFYRDFEYVQDEPETNVLTDNTQWDVLNLPPLAYRGEIKLGHIIQQKNVYNLILSFEDMSLVNVEIPRGSKRRYKKNAMVTWIREEALSSITEVLYYAPILNDLTSKRKTPPTLFGPLKSLHKLSTAQKRFIHNILSTVIQPSINYVMDTLSSIYLGPDASSTPDSTPKPRILEPLLPKELLVQTFIRNDSINNQIIATDPLFIALTCGRRIFALNSRTGSLVWATDFMMNDSTTQSITNRMKLSGLSCSPILSGNFWIGQSFIEGGRVLNFQYSKPRSCGTFNYTEPENDNDSNLLSRKAIKAHRDQSRLFLLRNSRHGESSSSSGVNDDNNKDHAVLASVHAPYGKISFRSLLTGERLFNDTQLDVNESNQHITSTKLSNGASALINAKRPCSLCIDMYGKSCTQDRSLYTLKTFDIKSYGLEGYEFDAKCFPTAVWSIDFQNDGDSIIAVATTLPEKHAIPVHVRGDGRVLQKINTENAVAVLTYNLQQQTMKLFLIDINIGTPLLSMMLPKGASFPAKIILIEHRIIVHYWNKDTYRFELLSLEMFYDIEDKGPWKLILNSFWPGVFEEQQQPKIEILAAPPKVFAKTFIFGPSGIRAMAFTQTGLSITPQSLLVATSSGQIYSLNHRVITPRRPYPPPLQTAFELANSKDSKSAEEMEELIPPYNPVIPLIPSEVLSYYHELGYIRGIVSAGTAMESSSMVLAFGLDLFSTIARPAASIFDTAGDLYNPPVLFTILVLAFSFVAFARKLAREKELTARWKQ